MDEDEWTDRNFGGNSLVMIEEDNNTSEDSATSLDSDEDDPDDEDSKKPLSAKEARQLQREWLKRIQNGDDDEEISHYDNVKGHRYVIFFSYKQFLFYNIHSFCAIYLVVWILFFGVYILILILILIFILHTM